ncbi:MAG TPA: type II toxin-antitoxin system RelE/ParE family toxin [Ignavibacteria bacterium]|nr:type II toxin-antitoxin system RelE/ParE family toxin [Ignavibacteria bacterium]HMR41784.1 type II toxin-antitoxin system RelE/ParE family toxin [Ignavibacteria bacterium]
MNYEVRIISIAEKDLDDIYENVAKSDSINNAEKLYVKIIQICLDLNKLPNRGHILSEFEFEKKDFLEIHYKTYRIIYKIFSKTVMIYGVLDRRRDLKDLLNKRLLR